MILDSDERVEVGAVFIETLLSLGFLVIFSYTRVLFKEFQHNIQQLKNMKSFKSFYFFQEPDNNETFVDFGESISTHNNYNNTLKNQN